MQALMEHSSTLVVVTMVTRSFLIIEVHGRVGCKSIPNFFVSPVATEVRFKALI